MLSPRRSTGTLSPPVDHDHICLVGDLDGLAVRINQPELGRAGGEGELLLRGPSPNRMRKR
jgi:hypothetical protein